MALQHEIWQDGGVELIPGTGKLGSDQDLCPFSPF